MVKKFKAGNHVTWNSEAGYASGRIIKIHKKDVEYKGYTHHATAELVRSEPSGAGELRMLHPPIYICSWHE